jgi:beta-lactamase class A
VAARSADAAVAALVSGRPADSVSIAALDTATGTRYGWNASTGMTAGSVAKLLLLESALLHEQDRGQAPGGDQTRTQTLMIENSDNDAGDAVFADQGGTSGLTEAIPRLGLSSTTLGPLGQWGLSTTTAGDQLVLLEDLVSASSPLSADFRAFALGLMGSVEPDQRWGVAAAADPSTPFANKNGWLPVDDDDGLWAVNSVGVITVHDDRVLMSVLTQHDASLDDGTALVESLARTAVTAVVPGR